MPDFEIEAEDVSYHLKTPILFIQEMIKQMVDWKSIKRKQFASITPWPIYELNKNCYKSKVHCLTQLHILNIRSRLKNNLKTANESVIYIISETKKFKNFGQIELQWLVLSNSYDCRLHTNTLADLSFWLVLYCSLSHPRQFMKLDPHAVMSPTGLQFCLCRRLSLFWLQLDPLADLSFWLAPFCS